MTKEWYKAHGYQMGINGTQELIDRAEREVKAAYISPILPNADYEDDEVMQCLADLAFARVMQNTIFVTRTGAKEKFGSQSSNASDDVKFQEQGRVAASAVDKLRLMSGANAKAKVDDICYLFFVNTYFHN